MDDKSLKAIQAETEAKVAALHAEMREQDSVALKAYRSCKQVYMEATQNLSILEYELKKDQNGFEQTQVTVSKLQKELKQMRGLSGLLSGKRTRLSLDAKQNEIEHAQEFLRKAEERAKSSKKRFEDARAEMPDKPVLPAITDERRDMIYQCAQMYLQAGMIASAAREFSCIRGYRDVEHILGSDRDLNAAAVYFAGFAPGSYVCLGRYSQGEETEGAQPVEWLVLANDGENATLISKYALEFKAFSYGKALQALWNASDLRRWLNGEFLNTAFSEEEQAKLAVVTVEAVQNPQYTGSLPGYDTQDKVYLLNIQEAEKYFASDDARVCRPTRHAQMQGECNPDGIQWWLRSTGSMNGKAADVSRLGKIIPTGFAADVCIGVRPVITLRLATLEEEIPAG